MGMRACWWVLAAASVCAGQTPRYTPEQFYQTTAISGASITFDETRVLFSSDASGVFNVYSVPGAGGTPTQLTFSRTNAYMVVGAFPTNDRFLFTADQGGNELNHLFVREPSGSVIDLTPGEGKLKAQFLGWSSDDASFWALTNERDNRFFDLYRYDTEGYARELAFRNDAGFVVEDVSPDGRWVALVKVNSNADSDLFVLDRRAEAPEPKLLTPRQDDEPIQHNVASFTPDSAALLFLSNAGGEFDRLRSYVLAGAPAGEKNHRVVEEAPWDIMYSAFSHNGRYRVTGINADARTELRLWDTRTNEPVALPSVPAGDITSVSFSRSARVMAFYVSADTSPANLYVMDMATGQYKRLTNNLNPRIKEEHLVASKVVRYKSFDGVDVPAILYRPRDAAPNSKAPGLVWVHGGPGGQSRVGYSPNVQVLANHGYAVLMVNNRGSSGYGKTFFHMDDRNHGEGDLQDCIFGRKYLESLDWVDGERIGIIGGSYGGFMVAAALAFEPEAFDVGINLFGVTNWIRTLESIPPWWSAFAKTSLYAELGDPVKDKERLTRISPLFHAKNIRRPMLVFQGANDPRVLQVESDELVEAARKNGAQVEYVVFPDEGHGFQKKANRIKAAESQLDFLDRYLRGGK